MKLTDSVRFFIRLQLRSGAVIPFTYDDPQPVSWWIGQAFDGDRQTVLDVWLSPIGTKWSPAKMEPAAPMFAACVVAYLRDRDPSTWPADMVAFVDRYPNASHELRQARVAWDEFDSRADAAWRTPGHPDKQDAWRGL
jgi:hypothetical protein